jgi:ABC-type multidrug transport system fused ATPase/permease subunit
VLRGGPERVLPFGALALLAAALRALAAWGESWLAHDIAFGLLAKVRLSLYDAFGRQGPAVLGRTRTGALTTAAMSDAEALEEYYAHSSVYQFGAFLATPLLLGALAVVSPRAALACVPVMLAGFLLTVAARGLARRYGGEVRLATSELGGLATELGGAVREVVAFGHRDLVAARLDAGQARLDRALRANALVTSLDALVIGLTGAGCAVVAAVAVSDGSAAVATPLVLALAGVCAAPLAQWAAGTRRHGMTVGAAARIRSVLEAPGPVAAYGTRTDPRDEGSVRAEALTFGWASVPDGPFADDAVGPEESLARAVDEADLTITPGEHVALAGPSGAGKSTLAALITRAVDAEGGTIVVAGRAVAEYAEADLAKVASLLPQYPALFTGTLRENLQLARDTELTDQELEEVIAAVGADGLAARLGGLDAPLRAGMVLSGGERQRLALARALLQGARILVLDEPVSQIDVHGERELRDTLRRARARATTLTIAHRLSTLLASERIVVMDEGRIVGDGPHAELLETCPAYRRLVGPQLEAIE